MGKKKGKSGSGEAHFFITQSNLDRKGKTNKKLKRNPNAMKNLTSKGREIKEQAEAYAKEHYGAAKKRKQEWLKRMKPVEEKREEHGRKNPRETRFNRKRDSGSIRESK